MKQRHRTSGKESTVRSGALEERNASAGLLRAELVASQPAGRSPGAATTRRAHDGPGGTALNAALGITH